MRDLLNALLMISIALLFVVFMATLLRDHGLHQATHPYVEFVPGSK